MMYGDEDGEQGPRGTYEIYRAEGDLLTKGCQYKKAINSYSTALELNRGDKDCLVSRSRCYLLLGDPDSALRDAEACLAEQSTFHKGLYQKAEALYFKGEFELALMFYHRGHRMRPELEEFRLGIQKAREAIQNSVGSPERVKLTKAGDLSYFDQLAIGEPKPTKMGRGRGATLVTRSTINAKPQSAKNDPHVRKLLGELYGDRVYLEELLKDPVASGGPESEPINALVIDGIKYLDSRTEFWRQQKASKIHAKEKKNRFKDPKFVMAELETVGDLQSDGNYVESMKRAERLLKSVDLWGTGVSREQTVGHIYSYLGNVHLEEAQYDKAEEYYKEDLSIGQMNDIGECKTRAHQNLARLYTCQGFYLDAVPYWRAALVDVQSLLEQTWIYHELGRCLLEQDCYEEALECSKESLFTARKANDVVWQLNASVLMGQVFVGMEQYDEATLALEEALDFAKVMHDATAKKAIRTAINNLKTSTQPEKEEVEEAPTTIISATVQPAVQEEEEQ